LVAPPHLAGLVEHHLSSEAKKQAKPTIHKDYTISNTRAAQKHLEDAVFTPTSH
jgi:hypothetical protein